MTLPDDFHFSQGSMQDYQDCRRRFQLRYLLRAAWPALESEPVQENERAMQQGVRFHRLIQQHLLGIPAERLTPLAQGDNLSRWWQNYLEFTQDPQGLHRPLGSKIYPEITLSAPLSPRPSPASIGRGAKGEGSFRLLAKYDLISISPDGKATIFDWKTSRKRPKRSWLLERLQTRVYPYLLVQAGAFLFPSLPPPIVAMGAPRGVQPDQVEMIYWFAEAPHETEKINYSADQFQRDSAFLSALVGEIAGLSNDADGQEHRFTLTTHEDRCRFCTYRSLCDRGVKAGNLSDSEAEESDSLALLDFDFEQIAEIEF